MNIDDSVAPDQVPDDQVIPRIFSAQLGLYKKYVEIERRNGFYKPAVAIAQVLYGFAQDKERTPLNQSTSRPSLDDAQFQNWIKNMFWRVAEELAEAVEPIAHVGIHRAWPSQWDTDANIRHFFEELADAVHFLAEVTAVYGDLKPCTIGTEWVSAQDIIDEGCQNERVAPRQIQSLCFGVVYQMGLAANCLKNKPWKTTQMATDKDRFEVCLGASWTSMAILFSSCWCPLSEVYSLYFKKNQVNVFRQNTAY